MNLKTFRRYFTVYDGFGPFQVYTYHRNLTTMLQAYLLRIIIVFGTGFMRLQY
jgi:hypothetical protein